jgi:prepilin-type N-terminal cleavage/methylation domain-containing protein
MIAESCMMDKPRGAKRGFTLIEVMVVITIMGFLAMVAVPSCFGLVEKARENVDLMKLFFLRDALNRALVETEEALYQSDFVTKGKDAADNLNKLKDALKSAKGVDLFIIEMRPDMPTNVQNNHATINSDSKMSKMVGSSGAWYNALNEAGFEGVADILIARNNNDKTAMSTGGDTFYGYSYNNGQYYRTYPKKQMFISRELNSGKSIGLLAITSQKDKNGKPNVTNYRLTVSFQWTGRNPSSRSVEVALLPANGDMLSDGGTGGALLTEHGVCFSTYGPKGCTDFVY